MGCGASVSDTSPAPPAPQGPLTQPPPPQRHPRHTPRPTADAPLPVPAAPAAPPWLRREDSYRLEARSKSYVTAARRRSSWESSPLSIAQRVDATPGTQKLRLPRELPPPMALAFAAASLRGRSSAPPEKPNQDEWLAVERLAGDPALFLAGVFDGHGPAGEDLAAFARSQLPRALVAQPGVADGRHAEALVASFEAMQQLLASPATKSFGIDSSLSGTTAVALLVDASAPGKPPRYFCANAGDSRAILLSVDGRSDEVIAGSNGDGDANGRANGRAICAANGGADVGNGGSVLERRRRRPLAVRALSSDHKPLRVDERERVLASGNASIVSERDLGVRDGDESKLYICRCHPNGTIRYGVLFSRSIGDEDAHTFLGLLATPEVAEGDIDLSADRVFVLASDGVWDALENDEVAALVQRATGLSGAPGDDDDAALARAADSAQAAADAVVAEAARRWNLQARRDDITVVVIMVHRAPALSETPLPPLPCVSEESGSDADAFLATPLARDGLSTASVASAADGGASEGPSVVSIASAADGGASEGHSVVSIVSAR